MSFVFQTRRQDCNGPGFPLDPTKYVRRNWSIFVAYYLGTSLALGIGLMAGMLGIELSKASKGARRNPLPAHNPMELLAVVAGFLSAVIFLIQLATGPFVFTTDVVCRKCHGRLRVRRIPFLAGKYSRPPRCHCGGKIEPAFLWKPEPAQDRFSKN